MSCLPQFPAQNAIPPVSFYNFQGLANWLNNNPSYKVNFSYTGYFPFLYPPEYITSSLSSVGYNPEKVPLASNVTILSQYQSLEYRRQIELFCKVYAYNSNAYVNFVCNNITPIYYNFADYKEKYQYNSAVALINKLYPFRVMADAPGLNWQVPFPIQM